MPALQPPSMQVGALPTGAGPLPPAGPVRQLNQTPGLPVLIQSAGASTNASGPTNISQAVTSTKVGTLLVWAVAVSASAAAALGGVPAGGWTLATSQAVATLALGIYVLPNNPGAVTAVTFSSNATATAGGIASWFWEIDNAPFAVTQSGSANGSSTGPASGALTAKTDSALILGAVAWVLGAATLTPASTGGYTYTSNAQQSSTNGATNNAALVTQSNTVPFGTPAAAQIAGTLSGSAVWAAGILIIPSSGGSSPTFLSAGRANVVDGGAGYAVGETGFAGFALGGTKPGGAGGGQ